MPEVRHRRRLLVVLAAVGIVAATALPAWAYWSDDVEVTGATATADTVPAATGLTCTMTNNVLLTPYYTGMRIQANVPSAPGYDYAIELARMATPDTVIWSHPLSASGGGVTYDFVDSDITVDQPTQDSDSVDYYVRIVVSLAAAPSWNAVARINIDANYSPGTIGIGADVYYGSQTGTTSPGGQPGQCSLG